jgi:hypothetical protein
VVEPTAYKMNDRSRKILEEKAKRGNTPSPKPSTSSRVVDVKTEKSEKALKKVKTTSNKLLNAKFD